MIHEHVDLWMKLIWLNKSRAYGNAASYWPCWLCASSVTSQINASSDLHRDLLQNLISTIPPPPLPHHPHTQQNCWVGYIVFLSVSTCWSMAQIQTMRGRCIIYHFYVKGQGHLTTRDNEHYCCFLCYCCYCYCCSCTWCNDDVHCSCLKIVVAVTDAAVIKFFWLIWNYMG